jgi:hypothetical protein
MDTAESGAPDPARNEADPGYELLDTGQEEVFSRAEVERGVTEHASEAGRHPLAGPHDRETGGGSEHAEPLRRNRTRARALTLSGSSEGTMTEPYDLETTGPMNGSPPSALREAALEAKAQAGVLVDQAAARAKAMYRQSKDVAGRRAGEARDAIVERPLAAVGAIFLAGLVLGHALSSGRAQVVYLKDRR